MKRFFGGIILTINPFFTDFQTASIDGIGRTIPDTKQIDDFEFVVDNDTALLEQIVLQNILEVFSGLPNKVQQESDALRQNVSLVREGFWENLRLLAPDYSQPKVFSYSVPQLLKYAEVLYGSSGFTYQPAISYVHSPIMGTQVYLGEQSHYGFDLRDPVPYAVRENVLEYSSPSIEVHAFNHPMPVAYLRQGISYVSVNNAVNHSLLLEKYEPQFEVKQIPEFKLLKLTRSTYQPLPTERSSIKIEETYSAKLDELIQEPVQVFVTDVILTIPDIDQIPKYEVKQDVKADDVLDVPEIALPQVEQVAIQSYVSKVLDEIDIPTTTLVSYQNDNTAILNDATQTIEPIQTYIEFKPSVQAYQKISSEFVLPALDSFEKDVSVLYRGEQLDSIVANDNFVEYVKPQFLDDLLPSMNYKEDVKDSEVTYSHNLQQSDVSKIEESNVIAYLASLNEDLVDLIDTEYGQMIVDKDDPDNTFYHILVNGKILEVTNNERNPLLDYAFKSGDKVELLKHKRDLPFDEAYGIKESHGGDIESKRIYVGSQGYDSVDALIDDFLVERGRLGDKASLMRNDQIVVTEYTDDKQVIGKKLDYKGKINPKARSVEVAMSTEHGFGYSILQ